jgi:hypothetical protein
LTAKTKLDRAFPRSDEWRRRMAELTSAKARRDEDEKFFVEAMKGSLRWTTRRFYQSFHDPQLELQHEPVTRDIWKNLDNLAASMARRYKEHATVDMKNPRHHSGWLNLAFGLNMTMDANKLSPLGNYIALLNTLLSEVVGIEGRVMSARFAVLFATLIPHASGQLKSILQLLGTQGSGKSTTNDRIQYLVNGEFDNETKINWFHNTGSGSAKSLRAGGIARTSGGVEATDEVIRCMASGGETDPTAREQMQDLKQATSSGKTCCPRAEQRRDPSGLQPNSYVTVLHVQHRNTCMITAHNLGVNISYPDRTGVGMVPIPDKKALIDRSWALPLTTAT